MPLLLLLLVVRMLRWIHAVIPRMLARRSGSRWPLMGGITSGGGRRIAREGHSVRT